MRTTETEHQLIFQSEDYRGVFEIRISKNLRQIQFEPEMGDYDNTEHVNVNLIEVEALRDMLTRAIDKYKSEQAPF